VWIIREGTVELSVGAGRRRQVVQLLHPGDVDGDVQLILGNAFPYTARASSDVRALFLETASFERLLAEHPMVARRWLSSVATRVVRSQNRILGLLGKSLTGQVARLLTEEAVEGRIKLPQRTLAAMLGVHRPSLNKVLKELERRRLVLVGYSEIEILDSEALLRLAS
jgi:CRP-like cAMP-binding protein